MRDDPLPMRRRLSIASEGTQRAKAEHNLDTDEPVKVVEDTHKEESEVISRSPSKNFF